MATISEMLVRIGADISDFDKNMSKAEKAVEKIGKKIQGLGESMSLYLTAPIVGFAAIAIKEFDDSSKAIIKLQSVLKSTGKDVNTTMADYQNFASALQESTHIQDEVILGMLQIAESIGSAFPKEAVNKALILSTALGMSEEAAMRAAVALESGSTTMLSRYIPALKDTATEAEKASVMNKFFADNANIVADAANTGAGKIKALKVQFGELMEQVGPLVMDAITPLIEKLKSVLEWFSKLSPVMKEIVVDAGLVTATTGPMLTIFGKIAEIAPSTISALSKIGAGLYSMLGPIGLVVGGITILIGLLTTNTTTAETLSKKIEHQTDTVAALQNEYDGLAKKMDNASDSGKEYNSIAEMMADSSTIQVGLTDQEIKRMAELDGELKKEKNILSELNTKKEEANNLNKDFAETTEALKKPISTVTRDFSWLNNETSKYARNLASTINSQMELSKMLAERKPMAAPEQTTAGFELPAADPSDVFGEWWLGLKLTQDKWDIAVNYMAQRTQEFAAVASGLWGQYSEIVNQSILNEQIALDNAYAKDLKRINTLSATEIQLLKEKEKARYNMLSDSDKKLYDAEKKRNDAKAKLEEDYKKKTAEIKTKMAKADKAAAVIRATMDTISASVAALKIDPSGILSTAVATMGAIMVAKIKAQPIPTFAEGGIISGTTIGMLGEYSGARSNPEVVAPLDKLKTMMGFGKNMKLETVIRGEEIYLVLNRNQRRKKYST